MLHINTQKNRFVWVGFVCNMDLLQCLGQKSWWCYNVFCSQNHCSHEMLNNNENMQQKDELSQVKASDHINNSEISGIV